MLDSTSAVMRDSYVSIRDTLRSVSARSALLQRDARFASDPVLLSRARGLGSACRTALRQIDRAREPMLASPKDKPVPAPRRIELDKNFLALRSELTSCTDEYGSLETRDRAAVVRGNGVVQAARNQVAIRNFERAAEAYLMSFGIRVRPFGAGENPLAGSSRRAN